GDPLCEMTFTELPEDARAIVENAIESLNLQWRIDGQAYDVSDLRDMTFLLTVNTKASPNEADWAKFNASRTTEGRPSNRRFIATLQLVSPPPELKAAVRELLLKKPAVFFDMKARVIADQVGLAYLLFSQE
ncbi:MAG: hypothetical protein NTW86_22520, partial [Candidatus Sumerlaeota bacterium]|nr:hypothetical protein [Candidatus Sumerlaeota bacterium]